MFLSIASLLVLFSIAPGMTHLEIAYSVNQFCQHLHSPDSHHWTALKQVLRYLEGLMSMDYFSLRDLYYFKPFVILIGLVTLMKKFHH
jgi:hypothetical protein